MGTPARGPPVRAVAQSLMASGVPAKNIVIWDRNLADLQRAGYTLLAQWAYNWPAAARWVLGMGCLYRARPALNLPGDHLYGKTNQHQVTCIPVDHQSAYGDHQHSSPLPTGKMARGHLQELAMAAADTDGSESPLRIDPAIPELLDRIAFSHACPAQCFEKNCNSYKPKAK